MIDPNKLYTVEDIVKLSGLNRIVTREPDGTVIIDGTGGNHE